MILGFKDQFVPMVLDGSKTHTIRAGFRWKAGMRADLYTGGYRPGARRLLFRAVVTKVERLEICRASFASRVSIDEPDTWLDMKKDLIVMPPRDVEWLLWLDGFRDSDHNASWLAYRYFRKSLPFSGQLIHWDYERRFTEIEDTWQTCYRVSKWTGRRAK